MVTPKEIDFVIANLSEVLAEGLMVLCTKNIVGLYRYNYSYIVIKVILWAKSSYLVR